MHNSSESDSGQSASQLLQKQIDTKIVSSLLEPIVNSSNVLTADWDLEARLGHSQSSSKSFDHSCNHNHRHHSQSNKESINDFVTVRLLYNQDDSLETQYINSEIPVSPPKLSQRGLSLADEEEQLAEAIEFTQIQRWLLLIFCSCCNVLVPIWMTVDIKSQSLTRSGWRIFVLSILLIPFVMGEQRRVTNPQQKFRNLLQLEHLKKIYLSSLNYTIWLAFTIFAVRFTARAHSFCLLRGKFFWITIRKLYHRHECHQGEAGGLLLVSFGIVLMFWDSFTLPVMQIPQMRYVSFPWWRRFLGDLIAIGGCLILVFLEKKCELPKGPRFSTLIIYYFFASINMMIYGYYLGGTELSFDPKRGVLGLFTSSNFVSIFYIAIMLGINLVLANVLVNHIFSQVIKNMAYCFQIVLAMTIYHFLNVEKVHTGTSMLAICFYVPGLMMIAGGQGIIQKLEMKINSEIYTSMIKLPHRSQITQIVLQPIHAQKHKQNRGSIQQLSNYELQEQVEKNPSQHSEKAKSFKIKED